MREMRIVDESGRRIAGFGTRVFRELTGGRFVTLGRSDLSRLLFHSVSGVTETVFGDEVVSLLEHSARCAQSAAVVGRAINLQSYGSG
jgi:hypothetical protein